MNGLEPDKPTYTHHVDSINFIGDRMNKLILRPTESGTYWRKPADPNTGSWELCEVKFVDGPNPWIVRGMGWQAPPIIQDGSWELFADQWYWYGPTLVLPPFEIKGFSKSDMEAVRKPPQEVMTDGFANGVGVVQTDASIVDGFMTSFECGTEQWNNFQ